MHYNNLKQIFLPFSRYSYIKLCLENFTSTKWKEGCSSALVILKKLSGLDLSSSTIRNWSFKSLKPTKIKYDKLGVSDKTKRIRDLKVGYLICRKYMYISGANSKNLIQKLVTAGANLPPSSKTGRTGK